VEGFEVVRPTPPAATPPAAPLSRGNPPAVAGRRWAHAPRLRHATNIRGPVRMNAFNERPWKVTGAETSRSRRKN
jgi:hypothetical protein